MASIRHRLGTKNWFACFTDAIGRRVQRSTGTKDRKLALKIANEFEDVARKQKTEAQVRRVMSALHEQIHDRPLMDYTLRGFSLQWTAARQREVDTAQLSASTFEAYKGAVNEFVAFCGERADRNIAYLTVPLVAEWRDAIAARVSGKTAANKLKYLRTFLNAAWRDGLLPDGNPAAKVEAPDAARSIRRPFTREEIQKILAKAEGDWRGMVLAGLYTGQRLSDLAGLTWANVDLVKGEIKLVTGKTDREQEIPIAQPLRDYLDGIEAGDDPKAPIFPSLHPYTKKKHGVPELSKAFRAILEDCNLVDERPKAHKKQGKGRNAARHRSEITFHCFRHTLTSWMKAAGVPESVVRDLVGHESAAVSRNYTHVEFAAKQQGLHKLPDVTAD